MTTHTGRHQAGKHRTPHAPIPAWFATLLGVLFVLAVYFFARFADL